MKKKNENTLIDVKETKLSNGLSVATAEIPHVQSVAAGVWVGVGGRYETKSMSGVSHFIEHLLFKGTETLSARDISQIIEGCGGYCNAFTQEEITCYFARIPYNHTWKVLAILADMLLHPKFDKTDMEKERHVIIEEIMMYRDHPEQMVHERLSEIIWQNHALGRPLAGTPKSVNRMTRDDVMRFKQKKYVPDNTVFVFAGRIRHDDCIAHVEKLVSGYPTARLPKYRPINQAVRQKRMNLNCMDIEQTHLAIGFRTFGRFDKRRYTLKVLSVILGENMSSRLFQVVREKHGLAYSVHSSCQLFADTGELVISSGIDKKRWDKALYLILREIQRLKHEPVRTKELRRAKEYVIGHLRIALETPSGQMSWIGESLLNYGACLTPEEVIDAVQAVQPEDIQALANTLFKERKVSLSMLSKTIGTKDGDQIKSALSSL